MTINVIGDQLGQARPADTNAASIYSPSVDTMSAEILTIVICNTTAGAESFRLFHDKDGTTYDETTALFFDESLAANTTRIITFTEGSGLWCYRDASGNVAVRSSTGSALTFTVYGKEYID